MKSAKWVVYPVSRASGSTTIRRVLDHESTTISVPLLVYGKQPRSWRRIRMTVALVALIVIALLCGPRLTRQADDWWIFRQAGGFSLPASTVVYNQSPTQASAPVVFRGFQKRYGTDALVFLHNRHCAGDPDRLVNVYLEIGDSGRTSGKAVSRIGLGFSVFYPVSSGHATAETNLGDLWNGWLALDPQKDTLQVFAAQPDPIDSSHFSFDFTVNGHRGTTDVWLQKDATLKVANRPGSPTGSGGSP